MSYLSVSFRMSGFASPLCGGFAIIGSLAIVSRRAGRRPMTLRRWVSTALLFIGGLLLSRKSARRVKHFCHKNIFSNSRLIFQKMFSVIARRVCPTKQSYLLMLRSLATETRSRRAKQRGFLRVLPRHRRTGAECGSVAKSRKVS